MSYLEFLKDIEANADGGRIDEVSFAQLLPAHSDLYFPLRLQLLEYSSRFQELGSGRIWSGKSVESDQPGLDSKLHHFPAE